MTTVITSGATLSVGPGAKLQGGSVSNPPSYATFSGGGVARYDGVGGTTPLWFASTSTQVTSTGIDIPNQKIFIGENNGGLQKVDGTTGTNEWSVSLGATSWARKIAVDENGDIYVGIDDSSAPIKKLSGVDGSTLWTGASGSVVRSAVYSQAENAVYGCKQTGGVTKYNATTGAEIWHKSMANGGLPSNVGPQDGVLLPNGNIALATTGSTGSQPRGHYLVIDAGTGAVLVNVTMDTLDNGRGIEADATHVYVSTQKSGGSPSIYAWEHDGSNRVINTGNGGSWPTATSMGLHVATNQVYAKYYNGSTGVVVPITATNSTIDIGNSIGPNGNNAALGTLMFFN